MRIPRVLESNLAVAVQRSQKKSEFVLTDAYLTLGLVRELVRAL